ncbi:hypothetical protein VPH35_001304 [Triticum aestivum]
MRVQVGRFLPAGVQKVLLGGFLGAGWRCPYPPSPPTVRRRRAPRPPAPTPPPRAATAGQRRRAHPYPTCLHPCGFPPPATIKAGSAPSPTHLSPAPLSLPLSIGRPTPPSQRRLLHLVPARSPPGTDHPQSLATGEEPPRASCRATAQPCTLDAALPREEILPAARPPQP